MVGIVLIPFLIIASAFCNHSLPKTSGAANQNEINCNEIETILAIFIQSIFYILETFSIALSTASAIILISLSDKADDKNQASN